MKKPYGGAVRKKSISKYDLNGKLIKTYKSITEASEKSGAGQKEIINVAKGRYHNGMGLYGSIWRFSVFSNMLELNSSLST